MINSDFDDIMALVQWKDTNDGRYEIGYCPICESYPDQPHKPFCPVPKAEAALERLEKREHRCEACCQPMREGSFICIGCDRNRAERFDLNGYAEAREQAATKIRAKGREWNRDNLSAYFDPIAACGALAEMIDKMEPDGD